MESSAVAPSTTLLDRYSEAGASACTLCPRGRFGSQPAQRTANCSGPCAAGKYGADVGMVTETCSGPCQDGYVMQAWLRVAVKPAQNLTNTSITGTVTELGPRSVWRVMSSLALRKCSVPGANQVRMPPWINKQQCSVMPCRQVGLTSPLDSVVSLSPQNLGHGL